MDDKDWDTLKMLMTLEVDMKRRGLAERRALIDLYEQGLSIGGHWGPDADRYAELLAGQSARDQFPTTAWWRDTGEPDA